MSEAALDSGMIKMKLRKGKKAVQPITNLTKQDKNRTKWANNKAKQREV